MITTSRVRRDFPGTGLAAAVLVVVALLAAPWASTTASAAPAGASAASVEADSSRTAGPWAGVVALWQRIATLANPTTSQSMIGGGDPGGDVGQGLDPDGGTGDPVDGEEPPPPPPPDDGSTSGGGDGGSL